MGRTLVLVSPQRRDCACLPTKVGGLRLPPHRSVGPCLPGVHAWANNTCDPTWHLASVTTRSPPHQTAALLPLERMCPPVRASTTATSKTCSQCHQRLLPRSRTERSTACSPGLVVELLPDPRPGLPPELLHEPSKSSRRRTYQQSSNARPTGALQWTMWWWPVTHIEFLA